MREKIVELMAASILDAGLWSGAWQQANEVERNDAIFKASAALTALEAAVPGLKGLIEGTHHIIERPRFDEESRHMSADMFPNEPSHDAVRRAMIGAAEGVP